MLCAYRYSYRSRPESQTQHINFKFSPFQFPLNQYRSIFFNLRFHAPDFLLSKIVSTSSLLCVCGLKALQAILTYQGKTRLLIHSLCHLPCSLLAGSKAGFKALVPVCAITFKPKRSHLSRTKLLFHIASTARICQLCFIIRKKADK